MDPSVLVKQGDIIVVPVQHRLGNQRVYYIVTLFQIFLYFTERYLCSSNFEQRRDLKKICFYNSITIHIYSSVMVKYMHNAVLFIIDAMQRA